jgi:hypothetical protein
MMMGTPLMTHSMIALHIMEHQFKVNRAVLILIRILGLMIAIHALCNRVILQKMVKSVVLIQMVMGGQT